jgi:predicted permease
LAATLKNLGRVTLGFDPDGVSAVSITPRDQGYDASRLVPYYRELLRRVREVPGVEAVSLSFSYPFASGGRSAFMLMSVAPAGAEPGAPQVRVVFLPVSPDYFRTLKIPLLTGSVFSPDEFLAGDEGTRRVAVISQSAARRLFGDRNPVGQFLGTGSRQVVGVVGDARHRSLERADLAFGIEGEMIYVPFAGGMGLSALLVRSSRPHAETVAAVRAIARQIDSSIPLYGEIALKEEVRRSLSDRVLFARLLLMLSVLAVGLAAVGVYGLVAYGVATHTREIGIRIALGAQRQRVLASVLREGGVVGVAGVTVGLGAALAVARLLRSRLFGVGSFEPGTYALAAAVLLAVVLLASLLPARAATRVDPMVALRAE